MGTFKIRPTQLLSGGSSFYPDIDALLAAHPGDIYSGWYYSSFLPDSATIIQIVSTINGILAGALTAQVKTAAGAGALNDTLRFSFSGNSIYLDGSLTPIAFSGLPVGWTPLTAILNTYPTVIVTSLSPFGVQHFFLQLDTLTEGTQDLSTLSYSSPPSAIDLLNNGCGIRVAQSVINNAATGSLQFNELVIEGTYEIDRSASQVVLLNPTVPVRVGDKVKFIITSADFGGLYSGPTSNGTLADVSQIQLSWNDPITGASNTILIDENTNANAIIVNFPDQLWFYVPPGFGSSSVTVTVTFVYDGTEFAGSVVVGTLSILFENASGIYELVKGQTDDILYFREGFITDNRQIMLPDMREDEVFYREDFFDSLPYPTKIMGASGIEDDFEQGDFSIISSLRQIIVLTDVEIPSPFVRTAFLP